MRAWAVVLLLSACEGEQEILDANFIDEVVAAPARSADVSFLDGATCEDLLSVQADEIDRVAQLIARKTTSFPIGPDDRVFEDVPRGRPILIHVAARDETGLLIGRGCVAQELPGNGPLTVTIELRALPQCESDWRYLDVALVIDTTVDMAIAFSGNEHINALETFVQNAEVGTRFSIITHGHTPPAEHLAPTADLDAAVESIEALRGQRGGEVALFDSIAMASRLLRSRATCPRRPAILVLEAGIDGSETNIPVTEAQLGLFATQGDSSDDIYVHGIFATQGAKNDIEELFRGLSLAGLSSGTTVSVLGQAMLDARFAFDGLIVR